MNGRNVSAFLAKVRKVVRAERLDNELYSDTLTIELVSTRVGGYQHPSIMR